MFGPVVLAWACLGDSYEYEFFIGCGQIIAAMLLLYRRTATLGAILLVTILANIVFVNFSFNVCVKFFSCTYLLMALYLLADDAKRLVNFFILNRIVEPRTFPPLFTSFTGMRILKILGVLDFIGIIFYPLYDTWSMKTKYNIGKHTAIYGVWTVDSVHASSDTLNAKLTTDSIGWKKIIFENYDNAYVKSWKTTRTGFHYEVDSAKHTLNMNSTFPDSSIVIKAKYKMIKDTLIINGMYNKDTLFTKMRLQRKYFIRK